MNTKCELCGEIHSSGAVDAANVILNGKLKLETAFGKKTACGIASLIDNETKTVELAQSLTDLEAIASLINARQHAGCAVRPDDWSELHHQCNQAKAVIQSAALKAPHF